MKISVSMGQSFFITKFESIKPSVIVEDKVKKGESAEDAYERIKELAKVLFYRTTLEDLRDITSKPIILEDNSAKVAEYIDVLTGTLVEKIKGINEKLLDKNDE